MNIKEVYTISENLRGSYAGYGRPMLRVQIEGHRWHLSDSIITGYYNSYTFITPQIISKTLFDWAIK